MAAAEFDEDEIDVRAGFEAASPGNRDTDDEARENLRSRYPQMYDREPFRHGFEARSGLSPRRVKAEVPAAGLRGRALSLRPRRRGCLRWRTAATAARLCISPRDVFFMRGNRPLVAEGSFKVPLRSRKTVLQRAKHLGACGERTGVTASTSST